MLNKITDKAPESDKQQANTKFQEIAFAYAILSDPRRRRRYDSTGSTAESLDIDDDDFDWLSFFREQFVEVITPELIERDKIEYRESGEQRTAVLEAYTKYEGDVNKIYQVVMHSNVLEDDERFRMWVNEAIASKEVEPFDKYTKETEKSKQQRIKNAERQAKEAEKHFDDLKKKGKLGKKTKAGAGEGDLAALIQQRQQGRESKFFEHLEEKYGGGEEGGKKKTKTSKKRDEPSEEAFAEMGRRTKRGKTGK